MTSFILIYALEDYLHITPDRYHEWKQHAADGGVIIWNREGQVRIIENAVIVNAIHIFEEWHTLISAGRADDMPEHAERIYWAQGRKIDPAHHQVTV